MSTLSMVMPMAGRGSRFARLGVREPKPLVKLNGRPFFWWAAESVRRSTHIDQLVFVVLEEHVREWAIDQQIKSFYPSADIVSISEVTAGSAETAALGMSALRNECPFVINDCDHAFLLDDLEGTVARMESSVAGALMTFQSDNPNYSYLKLDADGAVIGTVEKQVASPFAIAGCYFFRSRADFMQQYDQYKRECPYGELFISGIYNQMFSDCKAIEKIVLREHFAFGTPEEFADVQPRMSQRLADWR